MRLLICRPMGGLNDVLCQIGRCLEYAQIFNRTLIVDANHPGTDSIRDSFDSYFRSTINTVKFGKEAIEHLPLDVECFPDAVRGQLCSYRFLYNDETACAVEAETQTALTFPFDADLPHQVLVHHSWGGGIASLHALKHMRLTERITAELRRRLTSIGGRYSAIHIRATDFQTSYMDGIERIAPHLSKRVFLGTDSTEALKSARALLPNHEIYSFSDLAGSEEKPLHHLRAGEDHVTRNVDAIVDLLILALAREFFAFKIVASRPNTPMYSGYSQLVANLRGAPSILNDLVRSEPRLARQVAVQRLRQWPKPRGLRALQGEMIAC